MRCNHNDLTCQEYVQRITYLSQSAALVISSKSCPAWASASSSEDVVRAKWKPPADAMTFTFEEATKPIQIAPSNFPYDGRKALPCTGVGDDLADRTAAA
jgi:hypothetical protein